MKESTLIGRTIAGRFAIEALVGEGAMGAVYRARQVALGTTVAVKVLHRPLNGEPSFAARFLREAQAASRIDHPSSMRVIDFGEEPDGLLYIAMEYLDGRSLASVLEESGPLPVERIVDIASQVLAALAVAHEMGVVHRDLKPENIVLLDGVDDEGHRHDIVKVCDFGVAKLVESRNSSPRVTGEGVVIGTPAYMSPEQARGEQLDTRSDLYSMGVLLFQLMTGKVPFDATTAMGTALMHVNDEPTRPRALNPTADGRLEEICLKAMRKNPDSRYQSARALRADLRALVCDDVTAPARVVGLLAQVEAKPRRGGMIVAAAAVAASVVAGYFIYESKPKTEPVALVQEPAPPTTVASKPTPPAASASAAPAPSAPTPPATKVAAVAPESAPPPPNETKPRASTRASARRNGAKSTDGARTSKAKADGAAGTAHAAHGTHVDTSANEVPKLPDPNAKPAPASSSKKTAPAKAEPKAPAEAPAPEFEPLPVFPEPPPAEPTER
ncbi:Serine/threonine protein kinase PrkC, regulator of stationary phase [Labilithrix luteola]|uniref:non-specific serine/threonine protein kinase n=1 Tax=Labilithrix luteola TaxID=1391654 RepID=A0A0K1PR83_9BACT|nr:serine/threonine-protein kinase [Labilithrix luteola]AKU95886.1 Serine/threonine protein kinase PrkC, regulator of stationary phase [Labilithrix luteola]